MLDQDTFLITLYVLIDDFCRTRLPQEPNLPGPALTRSEVMTPALFGQWAQFRSEGDFYRFATSCLKHLFPKLPNLSPFNRAQRAHQHDLLRLSAFLVEKLDARNCPFEAMDRCGVATRWCGRRGVSWMPEDTDKGY